MTVYGIYLGPGFDSRHFHHLNTIYCVETEFLKYLSQYGVLGLWTASLLWANHQQKKEQKEEKQRGAKALEFHQEKVVSRLATQEKMLEVAIEKIDTGLGEMRNKYHEERMSRMQTARADDFEGVLRRTIKELQG